MSRYPRLIIVLGMVAMLLLCVDAAAAKDDKPTLPVSTGKPARLTWTPKRITQSVSAGQTLQITAAFSSSADITEATLVIRGGLGKLLKPNAAALTDIKAGTSTNVTFTVTIPATGAHTQAGVVQVWAGRRMLAQPLPVVLTLVGDNGADQDDTAEPAKPAKPDRPAKPIKPIKPAKPTKPAHP